MHTNFILVACCIHGIRNDDIEDEPPFPEVFESFCKWLTKQTEVISAENGAEFYPGNVNELSFDSCICFGTLIQCL